MSTFTITADSCALAASRELITVTYKFAEGSAAYIIDEASRGHIKYVVIKKVKLAFNKHPFDKVRYQTKALYTDTFNGLWNEWDLCSEVDAIAIATKYLQDQQAMAQKQLAWAVNYNGQ